MTTIHIPTPLRPYTDGQASVEVTGGTVGEALGALTTAHSGLAKHLRDDAGKLRSFVNIYLGDEHIRFFPKGVCFAFIITGFFCILRPLIKIIIEFYREIFCFVDSHKFGFFSYGQSTDFSKPFVFRKDLSDFEDILLQYCDPQIVGTRMCSILR